MDGNGVAANEASAGAHCAREAFQRRSFHQPMGWAILKTEIRQVCQRKVPARRRKRNEPPKGVLDQFMG